MNTDKHRYLLSIFLLLTAYCSLLTAQTRDYTRYVNPFIGTGGHGHTFPGAVMPFGMVQLSPDTREANWDGSSGYHYSDDIIYGFSHTHLSGTGIPDGCDILFMPTVGKIDLFNLQSTFREALRKSIADDKPMEVDEKKIDFHNYKSTFSHANEKAEAGYYSVKMDNGVTAELTATKRVGFHRYTFPETDLANIVFDLKWRDKVLDSEIKIASSDRIEGFRRSSSWAKDQGVYFVIEFSKPFKYYGMFDGIAEMRIDKGYSMKGNELRSIFQLVTKPNEQVLVKVGISYVSIEGARKNLEAELPGWDFDKVRADAKAAWNKELSKIEVAGGTPDQMTTFYTALYHTMIHPSLFSDVDGQYRGLDGKVHSIASADGSKLKAESWNKNTSRQLTANSPQQYTVFSLWDTFRAAHPLYSIVDQKRTVDFINTFIRMYEQGGRLPVWELWGNETNTMIGYHAVPVIADAMAKGIKGFDYEKAYLAAKHSAELDREGLAAYRKQGYISSEDTNESVSKTLEYAYDDWCIVQMADILIRSHRQNLSARNFASRTKPEDDLYSKAKIADYQTFSKRARSFENLFDPSTGFMRPKKNGGFMSPFAPNEVTFNFTEGNSWVYSFFAPHDVNRLIELQGGKAKFAAKLDALFTTTDKLTGREQPDITGLIGQYAHGNEPSHHIAYLYDYVGQPSKTQRLVRKIMDEFYKPEPDGLIGNEDCGQMSAWYVMSASGFYSVAPGQTRYDLGTPLFKELKIHLENRKTFTITAPNVSAKNIYIRSATLNGKRLDTSYIDHADIMRGGTLQFEMSDVPNDNAFSQYSETGSKLETPIVPVIEGERMFTNKTRIDIKKVVPAMMYWSMESASEKRAWGTEFHPFDITETTTIRAKTMNADGDFSPEVEATFYKRPNDWKVISNSGYSKQYTGGGNDGLIDGLRGSVNFSSGEWQGYHGKTFEAVIDLQRETEIHEVGGSFLQAAGSWIWMPELVEFEFSNDGNTWAKLAWIRPEFPQQEMGPVTKEFSRVIKPIKVRYVRVRAQNIGKIPSWHAGAGGDPWIFVDEVIVR